MELLLCTEATRVYVNARLRVDVFLGKKNASFLILAVIAFRVVCVRLHEGFAVAY